MTSLPEFWKCCGLTRTTVCNLNDGKITWEGFEEVSKLLRRQQEKIVEVVSALFSQYAQTRQ